MDPRIADLTLEEFRKLIRDTVREVLREFTEDDSGAVSNVEFRAEVTEYLRKALKEQQNSQRDNPGERDSKLDD